MSIDDRDLFVALWERNTPARTIGAVFDVTVQAVHHARCRFDLAARKRGKTSPSPGKVPSAQHPDTGAPWTPEMDARILETGGAYAEIAEIAEEAGASSRAILARWHFLRAGS